VPGPGPSPRSLALLVDDQVFTVAPPQGFFYVVLPTPLPASCVSLVIAEPPPESSRGTSLAEVTIFTDSDAAGGPAALAAQVAGDGAGAEGAARALQGLGKPALPAITGAIETAHGNGRRRLVAVLAALDVQEAAPALARALATAENDAMGQSRERALIVEALGRLGLAGAQAAAVIYRSTAQAPDARSDAAAALGRIGSAGRGGESEAIGALLSGLRGAPSKLRLAAVAALQSAGAHSPQAVAAMRAALAAALRPSLSSDGGPGLPSSGPAAAPGPSQRTGGPSPPSATPPSPAPGAAAESAGAADSERPAVGGAATSFEDLYLGDLARAIGGAARQDPSRDESGALLGEALGAARSFETRLRVIRAIGALGSPRSTGLLAELIARDKDDVLRWSAVEAAAALDNHSGRPALMSALADRDPRVRRAALAGLSPATTAESAKPLLSSLAGDRWPMVRRAAVEGLAGACVVSSVTDALAKGVDDPSEEVKRASLVALARCLPQSPVIALALEDQKQAIALRELAAALLAKGHPPDAGKRIAAVLDQVLTDPAADERFAGLATACARALGRLGDGSVPVLESLNAAAQHPGAPTVRAASIEAIATLCPTGAQNAFKRALEDPDPHVRQAATRAAAKCRK
jgi:HEAT repeat protein